MERNCQSQLPLQQTQRIFVCQQYTYPVLMYWIFLCLLTYDYLRSCKWRMQACGALYYASCTDLRNTEKIVTKLIGQDMCRLIISNRRFIRRSRIMSTLGGGIILMDSTLTILKIEQAENIRCVHDSFIWSCKKFGGRLGINRISKGYCTRV